MSAKRQPARDRSLFGQSERHVAGVHQRQAGGFRFASRLERQIIRKVGRAVGDYRLIEEGDRIMVCMSGGKDSYALLDVLLLLARRSPVRYQLVAVNLDQGWPGYRTEVIEGYLRTTGIEYHMASAPDIRQVVERTLGPAETTCALCSRLRRGALYNLAPRLACNKMALGHHLDDAAETLLLNAFFAGQLGAMAARMRSDDGRNLIIRPLIYVREDEIRGYATARGYPVVRCSCPSCGLPHHKRQRMKSLLAELEGQYPGLKSSILAALGNVRPSHLLDRRLLGEAAQADAGDQRADRDGQPSDHS